MKRRDITRILALVLAAAMCICLSACSSKGGAETTAVSTTAAPETTAATTKSTTKAAPTATTTTTTEKPKSNAPLVVAYSTFFEQFSPFTADSECDAAVVSMTQLSLMTNDRSGAVVYNAIEGEEREYNGTMYTYTGPADLSVNYDKNTDITTYTAKLRDDLVFSDGEPVTADDLIFNYYVYLDPSYAGPMTLNTYPIIGLDNYVHNNSKAEGIEITAEQIAALEAEPDEGFSGIINEYVKQILLSEVEWVRTLYSDEAYETYTKEYPEVKDLFYAFYGTDADYDSKSVESEEEVIAKVLEEYSYSYGYKTLAYAYRGEETYFDEDIDMMAEDYLLAKALEDQEGEEVPNIEGIRKIDEYTVEIRTAGYSAPAVYSILGIQIAPMHYYGDAALYDYENNQFGFTRGDVSAVLEKENAPMGAGPYRFTEYTDGIVYFEANDKYYKGEPETQAVRFVETPSADVVSGIAEGAVDAGEIKGAKTTFESIRESNADGSLEGKTVTAAGYDNLGYGYIGINADKVKVGDAPDSDASKNLRRALATLFAVYRDAAIESYYGDAANVIQYPISNTSWAAPQKSDDDYREAFSTDADGNDIYTAGMDADARYAAALDAAVGFLKAAGFTFDEETKKFTAAPEGAKLSYEIIIPGEGCGDHPSFMIVDEVKKALESIGLELVINDPEDANVLVDALNANANELWCSAWISTIDPDMYQIYHSSGIVGRGGSDSNYYHITSEILDTLITAARKSDDPEYRKSVYKSCLDTIIDWAVEVPCYQRQNIIAFSTERIDMDTVTPDITSYWGWMSEIERIEMN